MKSTSADGLFSKCPKIDKRGRILKKSNRPGKMKNIKHKKKNVDGGVVVFGISYMLDRYAGSTDIISPRCMCWNREWSTEKPVDLQMKEAIPCAPAWCEWVAAHQGSSTPPTGSSQEVCVCVCVFITHYIASGGMFWQIDIDSVSCTDSVYQRPSLGENLGIIFLNMFTSFW